ncbi:uncharacterized protein TM35_000053500 [Trypanosoma theileri]|uniref:Uncharacterized protein n=1 Tax=Trypanosoma theileri TaxID=67003 RepID=A0A1X0P489_9TRYP|nr:uncharacterized protein TM35_000053500 [Trypanosoma theileri]ORC91754.1 hypothetical protein TM35_000053500 [Trypanosoma theileri]
MEQKPLIEVRTLTVDQAEGSSAPLTAPLHIRLQYSVGRTVQAPQWRVVYEADIAYKRAAVPLLTSSSSLFSLPLPSTSISTSLATPSASPSCFSTSSTTATAKDSASFLRHTPILNGAALLPGELYELEVYLHTIDVLSVVPETFLLQVSLLRLALFDTTASDHHDDESDGKQNGNDREVGSVNFVVQVGKNEEGMLMRLVMNPMK